MSERVIKLIVLGDASVGKTATIIRYTDSTFLDSTLPNVGIDFKWKIVKWEGEDVKVQIWDTAGQEQFRSISSQFIRRAQGVILFYSVDNKDSYNHLQNWLDSIREHNDPDTPVIIIGNKADLKWEVNKEDAQNYAKRHDLDIFFTSAKTGENINEAFTSIANLVLRKTNKPVVQPQPTPAPATSRSGCC